MTAAKQPLLSWRCPDCGAASWELHHESGEPVLRGTIAYDTRVECANAVHQRLLGGSR